MQDSIKEGLRYTHLGRVATYIPELAKANPTKLGIALISKEGDSYCVGDTTDPFTLQSIVKVINLTVALHYFGFEKVFERVGMEPTGDPFNSLIKLETAHTSKPLNPMINAGAIAICALLEEQMGESAFTTLFKIISAMCFPEPVIFNYKVYESESCTGNRNKALAYFLRDLEVIKGDPIKALDLYFRLCSIEVTSLGLAKMGLAYAMTKRFPINIEPWVIRTVKTFLVTCGMYNASGEFAIRVGLPAKSGVSGGIMVIVPDRMGIGVIGPALDEKGNSIGGIHTLEYLSKQAGLSIF